MTALPDRTDHRAEVFRLLDEFGEREYTKGYVAGLAGRTPTPANEASRGEEEARPLGWMVEKFIRAEHPEERDGWWYSEFYPAQLTDGIAGQDVPDVLRRYPDRFRITPVRPLGAAPQASPEHPLRHLACDRCCVIRDSISDRGGVKLCDPCVEEIVYEYGDMKEAEAMRAAASPSGESERREQRRTHGSSDKMCSGHQCCCGMPSGHERCCPVHEPSERRLADRRVSDLGRAARSPAPREHHATRWSQLSVELSAEAASHPDSAVRAKAVAMLARMADVENRVPAPEEEP